LRYYASKIKQIWPEGTDAKQVFLENAYCGLSISNPNFYGKKLAAVIDFLAKNFNQSLLITSGYVYRFHYNLFTEDSHTALEEALERERFYIEYELNPVLEALDARSQSKISFIHWHDIISKDEFKEIFVEITQFYNSELNFKCELKDMAEDFIDFKTLKNERKICWSKDEAVNLSVNFLLEETAVFEFLVRMRYTVDVYPGEALIALREIKKYSNAPPGLLQRKTVELDILRRGRNKFKQKEKLVEEI